MKNFLLLFTIVSLFFTSLFAANIYYVQTVKIVENNDATISVETYGEKVIKPALDKLHNEKTIVVNKYIKARPLTLEEQKKRAKDLKEKSKI